MGAGDIREVFTTEHEHKGSVSIADSATKMKSARVSCLPQLSLSHGTYRLEVNMRYFCRTTPSPFKGERSSLKGSPKGSSPQGPTLKEDGGWGAEPSTPYNSLGT